MQRIGAVLSFPYFKKMSTFFLFSIWAEQEKTPRPLVDKVVRRTFETFFFHANHSYFYSRWRLRSCKLWIAILERKRKKVSSSFFSRFSSKLSLLKWWVLKVFNKVWELKIQESFHSDIYLLINTEKQDLSHKGVYMYKGLAYSRAIHSL